MTVSVGVSASHKVSHGFASRPGHTYTKDHHKNGTDCRPAWHAMRLGLEFSIVARLSKRPGSVCNCLWGHALKRSPGIIRKSRVSYPSPGFLSSATWPLLPKKHSNGLIINQSINLFVCIPVFVLLSCRVPGELFFKHIV